MPQAEVINSMGRSLITFSFFLKLGAPCLGVLGKGVGSGRVFALLPAQGAEWARSRAWR